MHDKLTDDELLKVQAFLDTPGLADTAMDVAAMEGFFAALAIGPRTVPPSQWMPWIWDRHKGEAPSPFVDLEQANDMLALIFRQYNGVIVDFMEAPAAFRPIYEDSLRWNPSAWCEGFLLCVDLGEDDWAPLLTSQLEWLALFRALGTDEGLAVTREHGDAEVWLDQIQLSLQKIHAHWLEQRAAAPEGTVEDDFLVRTGARAPYTRATSKVGRNDPCPCGSGKKHKKCCGTNATVH